MSFPGSQEYKLTDFEKIHNSAFWEGKGGGGEEGNCKREREKERIKFKEFLVKTK